METTEKFICHGVFVVSNSIGIEVEISNCGDSARCRYTNSKDKEQISEWLEIQYSIDDEDAGAFIVWDELEIHLNQVMRTNN